MTGLASLPPTAPEPKGGNGAAKTAATIAAGAVGATALGSVLTTDQLFDVAKSVGPNALVLLVALFYLLRVHLPHQDAKNERREERLQQNYDHALTAFRNDLAAQRMDFVTELRAERAAHEKEVERLAQAIEKKGQAA